MEFEQLDEELRNQQQETKIHKSKVKQLTLQLDIQHEKDLAYKAEIRLHDLKRFQTQAQTQSLVCSSGGSASNTNKSGAPSKEELNNSASTVRTHSQSHSDLEKQVINIFQRYLLI
jgi:hypothetical protein